ncbi:hypothetical protein UC8_58970 [Roseimaritima ulvae]|uniref:Uncharacterized protein n=1 Tax=Roseimaritima ulvae TaxID=980254 RepID=A0A5B9R0S5_9BACT|nr:hypothetical protein UC8_58970 [Roseimaritima ulvae]
MLDNVSFVGKKEKELTRELGSIKVQIAPPSDENGSADQAVNSDFAGNSWFAVGKKPILTLTRSVA